MEMTPFEMPVRNHPSIHESPGWAVVDDLPAGAYFVSTDSGPDSYPVIWLKTAAGAVCLNTGTYVNKEANESLLQARFRRIPVDSILRIVTKI